MSADQPQDDEVVCSRCNGSGRNIIMLATYVCFWCKGTGLIKKIYVNIGGPRGVPTN